MDRAENNATLLALFMLSFFFGLVVYAAKGLKIDLPTCITDVQPFKVGKLIRHAPDRYELHVVAKMWFFDLNEGQTQVEIPKGSVVDIYLTSADVVHGFHINDTNVNLMAVPGTVNYARVKFDRPGKYHIVCHEFCGIGHQDMAAQIVVK